MVAPSLNNEPRFEAHRISSKGKRVSRTLALYGRFLLVLKGKEEEVARTISLEKVESVSVQCEGTGRSLVLVRLHPVAPPEPDLLVSIPDGPGSTSSDQDFALRIAARIQITRPDFPTPDTGFALQSQARLRHGTYEKIDVRAVVASVRTVRK